MKKLILAFFLGSFALSYAVAQTESNPVSWSYSAKKIANKQYELHITATIQGNWHIYSQNAGEGPEPTVITFGKNPLVKLDATTKEVGKLETKYDPNFKSTLKFYSNKVDFVKKITLKSTANTLVKGTISYMVCNDKKCLPPKEIQFSIKVDGK